MMREGGGHKNLNRPCKKPINSQGPAGEAFEDEQDMIPEPLPEKVHSAEEKLKKLGSFRVVL